MQIEKNNIAIIGGGWYGCHLALVLRKKGYAVTLFERNKNLFEGVSGKFGIRLHAGPHYPRSEKTRKGCRTGFEKFCEVYPELIRWNRYSIYAVGKTDASGYPSKVDVETFRAVCQEFRFRREIDIGEESGYQNLLAAFDIDEPSLVLHTPLRNAFQGYLEAEGVRVIFDYTVKRIEKRGTQFLISDDAEFGYTSFDQVVNTTSYQAMLPAYAILPYQIEIFYQPCLALVYADTHSCLSDAPFSFIVMDGWFPCIMPYEDGLLQENIFKKYILTHGMWTILGSYKTVGEAHQQLEKIDEAYIEKNVRPKCEADINSFWPIFKTRFVYLQWVGAVLAKIKTEVEFRSAVTFQNADSGIIYVIPGKVSNIFDVESEVLSLVREKGVLTRDHYRYIKQGVLDDAQGELKEVVHSGRNTCDLQTHDRFYVS